jgi:hypothetical protein
VNQTIHDTFELSGPGYGDGTEHVLKIQNIGDSNAYVTVKFRVG